MIDGNTAIQVSPITEDDMNRVKSILQRAADAIVGMSQLHADVDMLRQTVNGLQADTDRLRNQNAALDEALAHSRTVRDDQTQTISSLSSKLSTFQAEIDGLRATHDSDTKLIATLDAELAQAKADRDDHGMRTLELEDALKAANAKLDKLAEAHKAVFGEATKPDPVMQPAYSKAETVHNPVLAGEDRYYHGQEYQSGYIWDNDKSEYYSLSQF